MNTFILIGLSKYFNNNFYSSPYLPPGEFNVYIIPKSAQRLAESIPLLFRYVCSVNIVKILLQFQLFSRLLKSSKLHNLGMLHIPTLFLSYLYVFHIFRKKINTLSNKSLNPLILIPSIYSPVGLMIAHIASIEHFDVADLQHGDCNASIFYSSAFINVLCGFSHKKLIFYVRTKNRMLHLANQLKTSDFHVIYQPMDLNENFHTISNKKIICLPYTNKELNFIVELLFGDRLLPHCKDFVIRPHPRIVDKKRLFTKLRDYGYEIDFSPVTDFKLIEYSFYFTFQSSIINFVPVHSKLVFVSRDLSEQLPKYANYFESIEEARLHGCNIINPVQLIGYLLNPDSFLS